LAVQAKRTDGARLRLETHAYPPIAIIAVVDSGRGATCPVRVLRDGRVVG